MTGKYDLIGDIHGHADQLLELLELLGYESAPTGHQHPSRKIIFLGDFIDRGEELRQHRKLLDTVMPMVKNGHALAVMGNHEFNALAFHTKHEGNYLRPRNTKNIKQHQAFLNEYDQDEAAKAEVLDFFYSLPLWLELDDLRVVHACWDERHISYLAEITDNRRINPDLLIDANTEGTATYKAIETILKGCETELPYGITFKDKDGHPRNSVRMQWWKKDAFKLGDVALPPSVDIREAANLPIPDDIPHYENHQKPCFIGHYWLKGKPEPLAANVACLDYSVAKNGKLVAYRWDGEATLSADKFIYKE